MSLRHVQDEPNRLTPEEARAFLQVHAEREAGGGDGPRVEDLAESLHIPVEEAREILREARARVVATPPAKARRNWESTYRWFLLAIPVTTVLLIFGRIVASSFEPEATVVAAPPAQAVVAQPATPVAAVPVNLTPDGFTIDIGEGFNWIKAEGPPAKFGTDYRNLSPAQIAELQTRLADATIDLLERQEDDLNVKDRHTLGVRFRVTGGRPTTLFVPLHPFTFPLKDNPNGEADLRQSLGKVIEAGWPSLRDAMPG